MDRDIKKILHGLQKIADKCCRIFFISILAIILTFSPPSEKAHAFCVIGCSCVLVAHSALQSHIIAQHEETKAHFDARLKVHETWLIDVFFKTKILPAMMMMTEQLTTTMMQQMMIMGTFFDAEHQIETNLLFQKLVTQAHKDYHPDLGMCVFGTNVRSLAEADHATNLTAAVLSRRSQARQLGNINANAAEGPREDREGRVAAFKKRQCDAYENNHVAGNPKSGLGLVCDADPDPESINKDIDIYRTLFHPRTLDIDFSDRTLSGDEQDILAMENNLYGHDVFRRINRNVLAYPENRDDYLDVRSVIAKRSVAENSFNAITAMKTQGTSTRTSAGQGNANDTASYMAVILKELGMPKDEIDKYLGGNDSKGQMRPSYMAQLEILAKKMYQRPEFYTGLYTKPMNVKSKGVAMQGISTMLDRDIYNSYLRSEEIMSILLELKVIKEQEKVQNNINRLEKNGAR